jgi:hypothetical protein
MAEDQEKWLKYRLALQLVVQGLTPLLTEKNGRMPAPAHASAATGPKITRSAFKAGALREVGVALARGMKSYCERLCECGRGEGYSSYGRSSDSDRRI